MSEPARFSDLGDEFRRRYSKKRLLQGRETINFTELLQSVEGYRAAALSDQGREKRTFTDLLLSVQGGKLPASRSSDHMGSSTMPPAPAPPTGPGTFNQLPSSNRSAACIPRVRFTPDLLPTNSSGSNHREKGQLPPLVRPFLQPTLSLSRYVGKGTTCSSAIDLHHAWRVTTQNAPRHQNVGSTASSSGSVALTTSEELETSGESCFEVNKDDYIVNVEGQKEDQYENCPIKMEQSPTDLEYDTYDDFMFEDARTDDDSDELFDYRLNYTAAVVTGTKSTQPKDLELEELELPSWYTDQVSLTESTLRLKLSPEAPPQTGMVYKDCNEELMSLKGEEIQELVTVDVHRQTMATVTGVGCNEMISENTAAECRDERAQIEHEVSTQRPKLNVDLERALKLFKDSEAVQESFKALYTFTEASTERGCFFHTNALQTVVVKKITETVPSVGLPLLTPKPEPLELDFPNSSPPQGPVSMVHMKEKPQEVLDTSRLLSWIDMHHQRSLNGDMGSSWKVRTSLRTLEKVWMKVSKNQRKDPKEQAEEKLRPDLVHMRIASSLRRDGLWLNDKNRPIGECPGVPVGACFNYRIEMALIGLHRAFQNGIAVVPADLSPYGKPVASSVVLITSKGDPYKDDKDMGNTVIYSGHGGLSSKKDEYQDQKLERGNLALANSFELGLPVRLIRGHKLRGSRTGRIYSYDGLYTVTGLKYENGVHGNKVYMFTMERLPDQPPLETPTMNALLYKGEDETDMFLSQVQKRRKRYGKFRTPYSQAKSSASLCRSAIDKSGSASEGAVLPLGWDNGDKKQNMSIVCSKTASCKSQ